MAIKVNCDNLLLNRNGYYDLTICHILFADGADLLKFYCNGADKLSSIRSHSKSFYTDVKVYLFDRRSVLKAEQLMVKNIPLSDGKIRTNLKEFLRESKNISPFECHLAMVVIQQEQVCHKTK